MSQVKREIKRVRTLREYSKGELYTEEVTEEEILEYGDDQGDLSTEQEGSDKTSG